MAKRERKSADSPKPAAEKPARKRKAAVPADPVVPIQNGQPVSEEAVRLLAYQKWEAAGMPLGEEAKFWQEAEKELGQGK